MSKLIYRTGILLCWVSVVCNAGMKDPIQQSLDYINGLDVNCVYDHGYQCIDVTEDDFLTQRENREWIPGPYLQAWAVCYEDFLKLQELDDQQKQLKHYKLGFTENESEYIVLFQGLLLPQVEDGKVIGLLRSTFGLSTKYWVDKKTLTINQRLFLR